MELVNDAKEEEDEEAVMLFGLECNDILDKESPRRTEVSDLWRECRPRRLE